MACRRRAVLRALWEGVALLRWLAVDYGSARTGLADCDESETVVTPIAPQIEEKSQNRAVCAVCAVIQKRGAQGLVCGLPKNMDGSEGAQARAARRFAQRLAAQSGLPVTLWDERQTTVTAASILTQNETFGKKRKERLDAVSAAVLLENFLSWRRTHRGQNAPEILQPPTQNEVNENA